MWLVLTSTAGDLKGTDGPAFFRPKFYCFPTDPCLGRALLNVQKDRCRGERGDGGHCDLGESPRAQEDTPSPYFLCSTYSFSLPAMVQCVSQG